MLAQQVGCLASQVTDQELEAIARGEGGAGMDMDTDGAGGDATRRLLGNYQTPARYAAWRSVHRPFKLGFHGICSSIWCCHVWDAAGLKVCLAVTVYQCCSRDQGVVRLLSS